MTKPDDIDHDAWEKAKVGVRSMTSRPMSEFDVASTIARAIMSAKAEEREACAQVADSLAEKRRATEEARGFGPATAKPIANQFWCEEIAAAIRNRP